MCILHVGHRCRPIIVIGRTWDDVRAKVRKQRKVWSARRARWQTWKKFGVDWDFVEQQSRIVDIKHSRRLPSKEKCSIIDADKRVVKKLKRGKCAQQLSYGFNILDKLESCPHEKFFPYGDLHFVKKLYKSIGFSIRDF